MAISWQTGEPPCGEVLVMQYEYGGKTHTRVARCNSGKNGVLKWQEIPSCHMIGQPAARWSTLDDDRAAKAMGALEKILSAENQWISLDVIDGLVEVAIHSAVSHKHDADFHAPTLIEAIEKLTEAPNGPESD